MGTRPFCRRITPASAFLVAALLWPAKTEAMHATPMYDKPGEEWMVAGEGGFSLSLAPTAGYLYGEALEKVWVGEFKLSELKWELRNLFLLGVRGTVGITNRFRVSAGYWMALNEGNGRMVDRDWVYYTLVGDELFQDTPAGVGDEQWSDQSVHPDTTVDGASFFDVNLDVRVFSHEGFHLSGILGYRHDEMEWSARGGEFIYSTAAPLLFRDLAGIFPAGEPVIEYRQIYDIPYFGAGVDGNLTSIAYNAYFVYSPFVNADDRDFHILRDTLFEGDFTEGQYFAAGAAATYSFGEHFFAAAAVDYARIPRIRGDVTYSFPDGTVVAAEGSGSVELDAVMLSVTAGWMF